MQPFITALCKASRRPARLLAEHMMRLRKGIVIAPVSHLERHSPGCVSNKEERLVGLGWSLPY